MSINRHYRESWVKVVFAQAVALFHTARKEKQNRRVPLVDLARQSANTVFQENADTIVGDKETVASAFMKHCREHFTAEIQKAYAEAAQPKEQELVA